MRTRFYFGVASSTIVFAGGLVAYILVPTDSWQTVSVFSYIVFIFLTGFSLYSFIESPRGQKGGDAAFIGIFAASGIAVAVTWFLSALTMFLSFHVSSGWAWSLNVVTIASFIVQMSILFAGAEIIDESAAKMSQLSDADEWLKELTAIKGLTSSSELAKDLQELHDDIYFGSSGMHGEKSSADSKISKYIDKISTEIRLGGSDLDGINDCVSMLKRLIRVRDSELKSTRCKVF